jgi:hypothetical protein
VFPNVNESRGSKKDCLLFSAARNNQEGDPHSEARPRLGVMPHGEKAGNNEEKHQRIHAA